MSETQGWRVDSAWSEGSEWSFLVDPERRHYYMPTNRAKEVLAALEGQHAQGGSVWAADINPPPYAGYMLRRIARPEDGFNSPTSHDARRALSFLNALERQLEHYRVAEGEAMLVVESTEFKLGEALKQVEQLQGDKAAVITKCAVLTTTNAALREALAAIMARHEVEDGIYDCYCRELIDVDCSYCQAAAALKDTAPSEVQE